MTCSHEGTLSAYDAEDIHIEHAEKPYGKEWAATVGRFQEGFLRDGVCADLDSSFAKAVDAAQRLLPAIMARAAQ